MNQADNFAQACPPRTVLCVEWRARVCVDYGSVCVLQRRSQIAEESGEYKRINTIQGQIMYVCMLAIGMRVDVGCVWEPATSHRFPWLCSLFWDGWSLGLDFRGRGEEN